MFLFSPEILQSDKFEGADFKYDNIIFKFQSKKYPNQAFLVPNLRIFFGTKLCNKTNSRRLISNMRKIFSNSSPKVPKSRVFSSNSTPKIHKSGIFIPKFKDFYFVPNAAIRQIWGHWFQTWQRLFLIPVRKYPNKAVFVLNVSIFYFCLNLCT